MKSIDSSIRLSSAAASRFELAARVFAKAEGRNGFPDNNNRGWRNCGYSGGEAEGDPDREQLIEHRSEIIIAAAEGLKDKTLSCSDDYI